MNTPISLTKSLYERNGWDLNEAIRWHLGNGFVISDNRAFCLGYPCHSLDLETPVPAEHADCVFISFLTGDMNHAFDVYSQEFDLIAFQREITPKANSTEVRIFPFTKFKSRSNVQ